MLDLPIKRKSQYRPEVDGLRAFAVIAVIINHFNNDILPGGYLGVDIFFVISGYVITSSLFGRQSDNFMGFIVGFYDRRIRRLVPALLAFVLITSLLIYLFVALPDLSIKTGAFSLIGVSNLYLLRHSTDYFAQSTELNVFTHTWSLGVEEQFYIIFPFLIWLSGFSQSTKNGARNLFLIIAPLAVASLVGFLYLIPIDHPAAYFLMPSRFWEIAAGCLVFIGFQKRASIEKFLANVPPLLVLALIIFIMYLPTSLIQVSTIAIVLLSSILIACLKNKTLVYKLFANPKVVYIGLISYSLYLWHWSVLSISRWTIGIYWWTVPIQVALIFGLAITSYRFIETPFRRRPWFPNRFTTLTIGGGSLFAFSTLLFISPDNVNYNLFVGDKRLASQMRELGVFANSSFKSSQWSSSNCVFATSADVGKRVDLSSCYLNDPQNEFSTLLVIGNSQNIAQIRMYENSAVDNKNVVLTSAYGCHISSRLKAKEPWGDSCSYYQDHVLPLLVDQLKPGDSVAIVSDFGNFTKDVSGLETSHDDLLFNGSPVSYTNRLTILYEDLDELAKMLRHKGIDLVIQASPPLMYSHPPVKDCVNVFWWDNNQCSYYGKHAHLRARQDFHDLLSRLAFNNANTSIFDPFEYLCDQSQCSYISKNGTLMFRDHTHLSDDASSLLAPEFASLFHKD